MKHRIIAAAVLAAVLCLALLAACGKPDPSDIPGSEELRRGLTVRQLQGMTDLMKQYCLECRYNVGVGHVLGALCAGWQELL